MSRHGYQTQARLNLGLPRRRDGQHAGDQAAGNSSENEIQHRAWDPGPDSFGPHSVVDKQPGGIMADLALTRF
ncbi:hypothetical protein JCM16408A_29710 [Methylobacterium phyllosphaerae]